MTGSTDSQSPLRLGPRRTERPADRGATMVAGIDGTAPALVDGGGAVSPHGRAWSVDWWIGGDDRWYFPSKEPAIRQRRVGHGPVIETSLRVPSGDVVHTVYPVVAGGGSATVIEIRNDSPVPVALAVAMRPYSVDGVGADSSFSFELAPSMVVVDGDPALVLPRDPNQAGASSDEDLLDQVSQGETLSWTGMVGGPSANAVCLYPLPHRTSLRFVIPGSAAPDPDAAPDAESVARGWTSVVDRASRFEFPDSGLTASAGAARARLVMAADALPGEVVAGADGAGLVLQGLAAGGHVGECRTVLQAVAQSFPTEQGSSPVAAAEIIAGVAASARLVADPSVTEALLEPMTQLMHLIERPRRGLFRRRTDPVDAAVVGSARRGLAQLVEVAGQSEAARDLYRDSAVPDRPNLDQPPDRPTLERVSSEAERASAARSWFEGDRDSAPAAARFWLGARELLIRTGSVDGAPTIDLLPEFPTAWRGGTVEVHRAAIAGARVSFAIRWHGYRPALLWDVEEVAPSGPVPLLRCPGLDPDWSARDRKGEALLVGLADALPPAPAAGDSFS